MHQTHTMFAVACLLCTGIAQAEVSPYYNPANQASKTGLTSGSDLYQTIGCPGQGLLERNCGETAPAQPAAAQAATAPETVQAVPAPAAVAAEATPAAPVAVAKPEPVAQPAPAAAVAAVPAVAAADKPGNPYGECYSKLAKQTADGLMDFSALFFKPMATR